MRIAVAYDGAADAGGSPDTAGVLEAVDTVVAALSGLGHAAFPVAAAPPLERFLGRLLTVDLIFNLVEGLDGGAEGEPRAAALMELSGRPVTGAGSDTLALCRRKDRVNALLESRGLPVPPWRVIGPDEAWEWSRYPAIVKPVGEDGSVGIDESCIVEDRFELGGALERAGRESLVQVFVGGRELNVGVVGDRVLPVAEIEFSGPQRLVCYAAKWEPGSPADLATQPVCPARIPPRLRSRAVEIGAAAWEAVGGHGYGRIDLRTDEDGELYILEVNPNPDLCPEDGLDRMARAAGWDYAGLVDRIVREALR